MTAAETIRNLYTLVEPLGAGGMGIVYRGVDRLNARPVAIKRVVVPPELLDFMSHTRSDDYYVGLAREFEVLASLRHPNIIAVYDYGFDETRQPYLVMELIDSAEELTQPAEALSTEKKVEILLQMFEALDYLHRRGVIHRDLKPSNVLMNRPEGQDYQVRVLDFGLSLQEGERQAEDDTAGTLNYMAPEVLEGGAASIAADLYAGGVIAYELLTGSHPFDGDALDEVIEAILNQPVDFDALDVPEPLKASLRRLMARQPAERYISAREAGAALSAVINRQRVESAAVRESFLQAASFVGRDSEIKQLQAALQDAVGGRGSSWLVGGESGAGKSRLLEELRIRALVSGVQVIRGQAVAEDISQFPVWRDVLRRLILTSQISDLEAGILKPFVPDISSILERPVSDIPELPAEAALQRLALTIGDLLRRSAEPLLIILEDLHWTGQSQELIRQVVNQLANLRVLVVGTFRNDEAPEIPGRLPELKLLTLGPLDPTAVMTLSEKMIGDAAQMPGVKDFIAKETEGNVFFLVEVVRALAEESGRLQDIGRTTLPMRVLSGGIQAVIRRRLERVPASGRKLLTAAAIGGRQLDIRVLRQLIKQHPDYLTDLDMDHWLVACSDAAVLVVYESQWRFAHDKFRETLLADTPADEAPTFNRHLAEAIEAVGGDLRPYAARLMLHWRAAADPAKELHYAVIAGDAARLTSAYAESISYFRRALELVATHPALDVNGLKAELTLNLGSAYVRQSEYEMARPLLNDALKLAPPESILAGDILSELGRISIHQGDYETARTHLEASLKLLQAQQAGKSLARTQILLADIAYYQGDYDQSEAHFRAGLANFTDDEVSLVRGQALGGLGMVLGARSDFDEALKVLEQSQRIYQAIGNREGIAGAFMDLGQIRIYQGEVESGKAYFLQGLALYREIDDRWGMAGSLNNLGFAALQEQAYPEAQRHFEQALEILAMLGDRAAVANMANNLGHVAAGLDDQAGALNHYKDALRQAHELGTDPIALEALAGMGSIYAKRGQDTAALEMIGLALHHPATNPEIKGMAESALDQIKSRLSEDQVTTALEASTTLELASLAGKLLKPDEASP
jgi:tetratricopeptide (TPR) repeat protein